VVDLIDMEKGSWHTNTFSKLFSSDVFHVILKLLLSSCLSSNCLVATKGWHVHY